LQHLLEATGDGHDIRGASRFAKQAQNNIDGCEQWLKRCEPLIDISATLLGRLLLPGMVGRSIEFASSARDDGAATYAHQPFIFADVLPGFALDSN
jgi:hypothetical protein